MRDVDEEHMAAVSHMVLTVLGMWTALSFMAAIVVGRALRRLEPVPVRVRSEAPRVVDLRRAR
ncbi:MAG: hypothetical protein JWP02_583 [Acidimicrobiales bacterium]|jgi:hypothetical protein|nr:hypothetical protein [Acidimicrobiales bacterium]